jgi:hypothetical protein
MEFKAMRMHCPNDENIIPVYRSEDSTEDSEQSTSKPNSAAAPKTERSPEHRARMRRGESEREYNFMKNLDDTVNWLSDDENEEPELNPKYMFTLTEVDICEPSVASKASKGPSATNSLLSTDIKAQVPILFDLGVNVKLGIVQVKLRFHGGTRGKEHVKD